MKLSLSVAVYSLWAIALISFNQITFDVNKHTLPLSTPNHIVATRIYLHTAPLLPYFISSLGPVGEHKIGHLVPYLETHNRSPRTRSIYTNSASKNPMKLSNYQTIKKTHKCNDIKLRTTLRCFGQRIL